MVGLFRGLASLPSRVVTRMSVSSRDLGRLEPALNAFVEGGSRFYYKGNLIDIYYHYINSGWCPVEEVCICKVSLGIGTYGYPIFCPPSRVLNGEGTDLNHSGRLDFDLVQRHRTLLLTQHFW